MARRGSAGPEGKEQAKDSGEAGKAKSVVGGGGLLRDRTRKEESVVMAVLSP